MPAAATASTPSACSGCPPCASPPAGSAPTRPAGLAAAADRGVLVHALLQALSFRRPVTPEPAAVRVLATRAGLDPVPGETEIGELPRWSPGSPPVTCATV